MYQNEKTISEKEIYKGRVVHLTCDEVELENGYKTLERSFITLAEFASLLLMRTRMFIL